MSYVSSSEFSLLSPQYIATTDFDLALGSGPDPWAGWQPAPQLIASSGARWSSGAVTQFQSSQSAAQAIKTDHLAGLSFSVGEHRGRYQSLPWGKKPQRDLHRVQSWDGSITRRDIEGSVPVSYSRQCDLAPWVELWDSSITPHDIYQSAPYIVNTPHKDTTQSLAHYSVDPHARAIPFRERYPLDLYLQAADFDFADAAEFSTDFEWGRTYPNDPAVPKNQRFITGFIDAPERNESAALPWGPAGRRNTDYTFEAPSYDGPITPEGEPIQPVEKEAYLLMNIVNAVKLPERTTIAVENVQIRYDVDSWAWVFTGEVAGAASMAPLIPAGGSLVDIEITINGHVFVFMVERYRQARQFASDRYTIEGVSRTQYLAAPYAPARSHVEANAINAVQAATAELANTGITLQWSTLNDGDTPDWTLPAKAWAYSGKTPAAAVQQLAAAAGAVIIAGRDSDEIKVQPRFRVSPWALDAAPLNHIDAIIPMSMVTDVAMQWVPAELFDSALVGGTSHGVVSEVTRNGLPGNNPAPEVFDDYAVATECNRERARQVIAGSGNHSIYSLTLPIPEQGAAPGVVEPGMVVEVQEVGKASWRGYVLATAITAQGSGNTSVIQTPEVVRFYDH